MSYHANYHVFVKPARGIGHADVPFLMLKWNKGGWKYAVYRNMYLSGQAAKNRGIWSADAGSEEPFGKTGGPAFAPSRQTGIPHRHGADQRGASPSGDQTDR